MEHRIGTNVRGVEIALSGRFTFADNAAFRQMLGGLDASGKQVTFNLSQVTFIDSAGMGMLLLARETLTRQGRGVTLQGARDQVKHLLSVTNMGKMFTIVD
ncbi:MAG: STAS domain-containing protein [Alphaproteobacteria bacterium]|nr:STAS domain-containing protein [Alphaproteobacteria bacterium]